MTLAMDGDGRRMLDVLDAFQARAREDLREGGLRSLDSYLDLFPGHDEAITGAWAALRAVDSPVVVHTPVSVELERLAKTPHPPLPALEEIARGGMGAILRVRDEVLERDLAMKVLLGDAGRVPAASEDAGATGQALPPGAAADGGSSPTFVPTPTLRRFLREAHVTAALAHPGVPPVHSLGIDTGGRVYFTMKLVSGRTLAEVFSLVRSEKEGWNRVRALQVIVRVCETVAFAHSRGVIHRDLKPPNVMVGRFGEVYVMDWGLAKTLNEGAFGDAISEIGEARPLPEESGLSVGGDPVTVAGSVLGTPYYMPPEQAAGRHDRLDARADVYALGAMVYEMVAGTPPYHDSDNPRPNPLLALAAVGKGPPRPLASLAPRTPPELLAIVARAMERDPAARYASAGELKEELQRFLDGRTVRAHRTGPLVELRKWIGRNRAVAGLLAGSVLLATTGATLFALRERDVARDLARGKNVAESALVAADAAARRAEGLRLNALSGAVLHESPATALLLAVEGTTLAPGAAGNDALYRAMAEYREVRTLGAHDSYVRELRWDPAGRRILSREWGTQAILWDADTGAILRRFDTEDHEALSIEFSTDGERVAMGSADGSIRVWSLSGDDPPMVVGIPEGAAVKCLSFSPDDSTLAVGHEDGSLRLWDAASGGARATLLPPGPTVTGLAFRPRDGFLVATLLDGTVSAWSRTRIDAPAWTAPPFVPPPEGAPSANLPTRRAQFLRITADGEGVLVLRQNHVQRLDAGTGALVASRGSGPDTELLTMSFNGGSGRFAISERPIGSWSGHATILDERTLEPVVDDRTRKPHRGDAIPSPLQSLDLAPDGRRLAGTSQGQFFAFNWRYAQPASLVLLRGHTYGVMEGRFSPDGLRYATASNDGSVRIWEIQRRDDMTALSGLEGSVLDFSADGTRAVTAGPSPAGAHLVEIAVRDVFSADVVLGPWTLPRAPYARFDDDGTSVWIGSGAGLQRLALSNGRVLETWSAQAHPTLADGIGVEPSMDGRSLLIYRENNGFFILDRIGGTARHLPWVPRSQIRLSPDGTRLLVNGGSLQTVSIWDFSSGRELLRFRGHTGHITGLSWSPDGTRIATGAADSSARMWDAATGREVFKLGGLTMHGHYVAFSPDGSILVAHGDRLLYLCDTRDGRRLATLEFPSRVSRVRFSGGDRFTVLTDAGTVHIRPVDPLPQARSRLSRTLSWMEMETHSIGTRDIRDEVERESTRKSLKVVTLARGAMSALQKGDLAEARFLVDRGLALRPRFPDILRADCCALALESTTEHETSPRRQELIERALERLHDSQRLGGFNTAFLVSEPLLQPLRGRTRFAAVLEEAVDRLIRQSRNSPIEREQAMDLGEALLRLFPDRPGARLAAARARAWRSDLHETTDPARELLRNGALELLRSIPEDARPSADLLREDPAFESLRDEPGLHDGPR